MEIRLARHGHVRERELGALRDSSVNGNIIDGSDELRFRESSIGIVAGSDGGIGALSGGDVGFLLEDLRGRFGGLGVALEDL